METSHQITPGRFPCNVLIPLPLTGMETFVSFLLHWLSMSFNSFTPHGDGNLYPAPLAFLGDYRVLIPLPLTGMETIDFSAIQVIRNNVF
ncbi:MULTISPECIES: hypothetical protein [unclassified Nostoc]|uniref:hypothetical protein n=1 Tax=unclassified Nostoc TaxID=2593658 RepID=UPI002AD46C4E|nr:hypothetical protein [Nostoc sp. DedQUE03]MDZ7971690.1 hypothetical protein [Nostoc sp. DedQUE03]